MHLGTLWDLKLNNRFTLTLTDLGKQDKRRIELLQIIRQVHDIGLESLNTPQINANYSTVIFNAQQDISTLTIQECTHCLKQAGGQTGTCFLELQTLPFRLSQ